MQRRRFSAPKYARHKASGQPVVTLCGRDFYLGPYGTPESRAKYDRLVKEWLAAGRRLPSQRDESFTVVELVDAYWTHCKGYYQKNGEPTSELGVIKASLASAVKLYGRAQVVEFGPLALKACREEMIEAGHKRTTINGYVGRIRQMFKWGVENELVPAEVWQALLAVRGLRRGRSQAAESERKKPVPSAFVEAIREHVSRQVWAIIRLQQLTGMRSGEAVIMRTCDLSTGGKVWTYVPQSHKTEHHGRGHEIYLGPQAQEILRPFLKTDLQAFVFSPAQAEEERRTELRRQRKTRVQPSQQDRRKREPKRHPKDRYTSDSYRRAVQRAIGKANELIRTANEERGEKSPEIPMWHPHQLRHNCGTRARKEGGAEVAQVVLGHSKLATTEIYAERDRARAVEFMAKHG